MGVKSPGAPGESCARPARAAKRESPKKTFNSDRAAAFDGKTNFDRRPAAEDIVDIGAMTPRAEIDCAYRRNPANERAAR
jgi:hypothetical protein